jgi:gliding motility-associated-like protein
LTNGVHQLIFVKKDGCRDTLVVKVYCTSTKLIQEKIYVGQKDTVCLDVAELLGNIKDIKNIWPLKSGEHAKFELLPGSRCITCTGIEAGGMDEAAFVITDEYGVQDTTMFQITVLERKDAVPTPEAVADQSVGKEGEVMILDVLTNDKLAGQKLVEIKITEQPKNGFVFVNQDNKIVFTPKPGFCDDDNDEFFAYKICTVGGCDDAPVTIRVLCSDIKVFTGFSPNNDGVNDTFVIEGVLANPDNQLTIFNRYGNQVYTKEGYRNDWDGTWNGRNLPDGTYFYLFEDGKGNTKAGYIQIQR